MPGSKAEENIINVLIADSSSYVRLVLSDILGKLNGVQVIGTAITGEETLRQVIQLKPDVLLMDLNLSPNSRMFFLQRLATESPTPVLLMTNSQNRLSKDAKVRLSELGVSDFVAKPANILQPQLRNMREELYQKLINAASLPGNLSRNSPIINQKQHFLTPLQGQNVFMHINPAKVIVLGASTGGTRQVETLVQWLPANFKGALLVAIHMPLTFTKTFSKRLKSLTPHKVSMAVSGMLVEAGSILIAPGGRDITLKEVPGRQGISKVLLSGSSFSDYDSPSIDVLMESVSNIYGPDAIGIILTGMGNDGTRGMSRIARAGGKTAVQDESINGVFGMAKSALRSGIGHQVLSLPQIAGFIEQEVLPDFGRQPHNQRSSS